MEQQFQMYFHLGLPKVASTYLQTQIFPHFTGINYYRKRKFNEYKTLDIQQLNGKFLFTEERDRKMEEAVVDIVQRYPDARFILILRRQDKWILSRFKYHIRKQGWRKFHQFFNLEPNDGYWKREELFFKKKIDFIEQHSKHTPLILTMEMLQKDKLGFIKRITDYMGIDMPDIKNDRAVNQSFNTKQLTVLRKFNDWYRYEPLESSSRFRNKLHYRYRQYLLHIVAFFSNFLPGFLFKNSPLLPNGEQLGAIKNFYKEDWEYCSGYFEKHFSK